MEIDLSRKLPTANKRMLTIARTFILLQIFLATWLGSGTRTEFLMPMFFTAVGVFAFTYLSGAMKAENAYCKALLVAVIYFILVCAIQYLNPFSEYIEGERFSIVKSLRYITWLPTSVIGSFGEGNSMRSLAILLSSFLTTISACILFRSTRFAFAALAWFVFNVSAMGLWAVYQKYVQMPAVYGFLYTDSGYYGSFFLSNAAGTFLNMGISAAFVLMVVSCKIDSRFKFFYILFSVISAVVCTVASLYSESRAAQILCFAIWGVFAISIYYKVIMHFDSTVVGKTVFFVTTTIIIVVVAAVAMDFYYSKGKFRKDISDSSFGRVEMYKRIYPQIYEHPIWGNGGECSRYVLPKVVLNFPNGIDGIPRKPDRPHSDIIEYILDYGIVGGIIFAYCGVALGYVIFKYRRRLGICNLYILAGVGACFSNGVFDMEMHIPSVMLIFGLMTVWAYKDFRRIWH